MADSVETKALLLQIDATVELLKQNLKAGDAAVAQFQEHTEEKLGLIDRAFEATGEKVKEHVGEMAAAFVAFVAVEHLVDLAKEGLEYAASLKEVAEQLSTTTTFLQQFRYAAGQVGIGQEEADKALGKFTLSLSKAKAGVKEAAGIFAELGVSGNDLKNLDQREILLKTADGLAKLKDGATRAAPEVALFGKTGQQLEPLLSQGAAGINKLAQAASDLGIILTPEQIERAGEAAHKFTELKAVLEANIASFVADNADAIYHLAGSLEKLALDAVAFVKDAQLNFGALADVFEPFLKGGETVFDKLGIRITSFHDQIKSILQGYDEIANIPIDLNNKAARFDQKYLSGVPGYHPGQVIARSDVAGDYERAFQKRQAEKPKTGTAEQEGDGLGYTDPAAAESARRAAEEAARKAAELARQRLERGKKVAEEEARLDDAYLSAQEGLTADTVDRAQLAREKLAADTKAKLAQADTDAAERKIRDPKSGARIDAENTEIKDRINRNAAIEADAINQRENEALDKQSIALATAKLDDLKDLLGSQSALATTTAERRDIALRLLAAEKEEEQKLLKEIADDGDRPVSHRHYDQGTIDAAKERLGTIDQRYAAKESVARQSNPSPIDDYKRQLHEDTDDMSDALDKVKVDGLKGITDGFSEVISGTKSVSAAFKEMAQTMIVDVDRINFTRTA